MKAATAKVNHIKNPKVGMLTKSLPMALPEMTRLFTTTTINMILAIRTLAKKVVAKSYREEDLTPPIIAKPNLTPKPPVAEATSGDVPESNRRMNNVPANPGEQEPEDKKPVSKYYHGQAEYAQPREDGAPQSMADATNENRPSDLKYMRHGQQEPQADMAQEDSTTDVAENAMAQDMGTEGTKQPTPIEEDAGPTLPELYLWCSR
jgi:hypothetical protein